MQGDVFKALADETRRAILDALLTIDGQTLTELTERFPAMTRFGVMKHLAVLEEAGLIIVVKEGRAKRHFLDPVPIAEIANRWISRYAQPFATAMVGLRAGLEKENPMTTNHVYQLYVRSDLETVWNAIVDPAFTRQYFFGSAFETPPVAGRPFRSVLPDGSVGVDGVVEELDPPNRLVHTWRVRYDEAMEAEPASRVTWTLTQAGDGLVLLRVVHDGLDGSPLTSANVGSGWPYVLDGLKSLVETGAPLPARYRVPASS